MARTQKNKPTMGHLGMLKVTLLDTPVNTRAHDSVLLCGEMHVTHVLLF